MKEKKEGEEIFNKQKKKERKEINEEVKDE
jgi:hypothetical protein